ncbi:hypothetical protein HPC49_29215 [Pyxidicoccus fallax]|uniref:Ig-like domain-containing protein n=1 Tax=Pyxidicoccus fallax TaxID=394095 RepID=A0A848LJB3_9BACT|nr:Ig-like domain-containing protein [Pyxidicoccus fallax]NMO17835.1 Ig-like domain-containing protein [Pyxidicoccus fallax]NPC82286.1 hypothetical protein [Pyxidicoccus fallax]
MRLAHATALLATCAALALTGCDNDDSPPAPDAGTPRDTVAPTVAGTTPAADEAHVAANTAITVRFSEPMKSGRGTLRVDVDGEQRALGDTQWLEEQRAFRVRPAAPLPEGARVEVTVLADFEDAAGNRLEAPFQFDFTVHGTAPIRPHLVSSTPAEGATEVIPVEVHPTPDGTEVEYIKGVTLQFNEPMDTSAAQVTLRDVTTPANAPRALTGTWSEDGLSLTVRIPRPEADLPALEQENQYSLDLTGLRSTTGQPLDTTHAVLGDGRLDFTTGRRNPDLEHACLHVFLSAPDVVTAGTSLTGPAPATDLAHHFYEVTLPAVEGNPASFRGYTEVATDREADQEVILYLNQDLPVEVIDTTEDLTPVPFTKEPVAPVCASGISHAVRFVATADGLRFLRVGFGPVPAAQLPTSKFTFVYERR